MIPFEEASVMGAVCSSQSTTNTSAMSLRMPAFYREGRTSACEMSHVPFTLRNDAITSRKSTDSV